MWLISSVVSYNRPATSRVRLASPSLCTLSNHTIRVDEDPLRSPAVLQSVICKPAHDELVSLTSDKGLEATYRIQGFVRSSSPVFLSVNTDADADQSLPPTGLQR
jgi:hypothetical protein